MAYLKVESKVALMDENLVNQLGVLMAYYRESMRVVALEELRDNLQVVLMGCKMGRCSAGEMVALLELEMVAMKVLE